MVSSLLLIICHFAVFVAVRWYLRLNVVEESNLLMLKADLRNKSTQVSFPYGKYALVSLRNTGYVVRINKKIQTLILLSFLAAIDLLLVYTNQAQLTFFYVTIALVAVVILEKKWLIDIFLIVLVGVLSYIALPEILSHLSFNWMIPILGGTIMGVTLVTHMAGSNEKNKIN